MGRAGWISVGAAVLVVAAAAAYLAFEGNLLDGLVDFRQSFMDLVRRYGAGASLALLYIEESGVPLPIPGDVYVAYIGHHVAGSRINLLAAWLGIIGVVTLGASNLYLISRRWGPRIVEHRMAAAFHIDPDRIATAQRWFARWGVLAIIFGRHIPGFRVPLTAVAGIVGFPYRRFAPSVAASTAVWAGFFLLVGDRFGRTIGHFLAHNTWLYSAGTLLVVGLIVYFGIRATRLATASHAS